jgi:hypothetical protein
LVYATPGLAAWSERSNEDLCVSVFTNDDPFARIVQISVVSVQDTFELTVNFRSSIFRVFFQQDMDIAAPVTSDTQILVSSQNEESSAILNRIVSQEPELRPLLNRFFPGLLGVGEHDNLRRLAGLGAAASSFSH